MHVFITGGTGLIGKALTTSLLEDGHHVTVLTRAPERHKHHMPPDVRLVPWNGRTSEGWAHLMEEIDTVVNLAGENIASGRWTAARKARIRESRLNAGRALVEAISAAHHKPHTLVQASAVGYYGPHGDEEVTEDTPPGSDFLAQLAVEWEASTAPLEQYGIRRVILRTGVVLSREGGALPRMLLPFRLGVGGRLGSGRQWFPWIHIADEVGAIRFLMEKESAQGPYNLTAPHPVTNAEFTRALGEVLHRPTLFAVPAFALRLLFGEMATVLLEGQRAVPKRLLEAGYSFRFTDIRRALEDLLA